VQPSTVTAYSGVPVTVTVTSGVAPFYAFSGNSTVLPVVQNVAGDTIVLLPSKVSADTPVTITVQDSAGQTAQVTVNVVASSILNSLTFAPSGNDCNTSSGSGTTTTVIANLCSGQTGTVKVVATGPGGAPLVARQIRFDVVYGPFGIVTSNPASPLAQTLTLATDSTGTVVAVVQANVNAPTQPAQIRATDVTSGQQQIANFTVVNNTVAGGSPLAVIPATATITGPSTTTCSSGFRTDYYIYGGNPPYTVSSTFPGSVVLVNSTVSVSGGFFETLTNGACVNPLTFTIVDSAGKQTTALLINDVGTTPPSAPVPLVVSPPSQPISGCGVSHTVLVAITGGQPSYNVTVTPSGPTTSVAGGVATITGVFPTGATTVIVTDQSSPQQAKTATITCS
jgi:hypothetical protein